MYMNKKIWTGIVSSLGIMLLIMDAKTAMSGANEGVQLCIRTIIPSLLPFFVLTNLLTSVLCGQNIRLLQPLGKLCGMPKGSESLLIIGLLGGYPVGAQAVMQAYNNGQLNKSDAQRLLGFCSNSGPAFLFGMISMYFPSQRMIWALWGIHILSAVIVGAVLPGKSRNKSQMLTSPSIDFSQAVARSVKILGSVCGWVILFRVIIAFSRRWFLWLLPDALQVAFMGLLELANGCCSLGMVSNEALRFILCAGLLGFGGLCVLMQTTSVTGSFGTGQYLPGRVLHGLLSMILAWIWQLITASGTEIRDISPLIGIIPCGLFLFISIFLQIKQNNCSNKQLVGV